MYRQTQHTLPLKGIVHQIKFENCVIYLPQICSKPVSIKNVGNQTVSGNFTFFGELSNSKLAQLHYYITVKTDYM